MDENKASKELKDNSESHDTTRESFLKMFHPYGNIFQAIPSEPIILTQYGVE